MKIYTLVTKHSKTGEWVMVHTWRGRAAIFSTQSHAKTYRTQCGKTEDWKIMEFNPGDVLDV